ncbi:S41 family peptidase [Aestuariibaculum sediminum]|uniref:Peptidase S41 n=1 Tax=Aestuariibaculum sediminum TaxID=2770637 RepID=A0A8J6U8X5_9FLAO|nr:S41 family peptidase [Aestuariibaculum sediminum]MBD0832277.1 peptidase S41 [Aestuariibaculum sediminum]
MKRFKLPLHLLFSLIFSITFLYNCTENEETIIQEVEQPEEAEPVTLNNDVNDFVWAGLNEVYLWQQDVPDLADDKFETFDEYYTFLNGYNTPESLFDDLLYQKDVVDRFSYIVDDYIELENSFQGTSNSNGLDFGLVRLSGSNDIFGYVRYVANDSDAASKDIKRGDFFLSVDGQQLTINNYVDLLFGSNNTYTLGMAEINNNTIAENGKTVELTKTEFTENPILLNNVIESNGIKIGYLMYNSFVANFDKQLNTAVGELKSNGITELVLDLRYNPGGSVSSAIYLSSMITGQFNGEIFSKEKWNDKYQAYFEANNPEFLINRFSNKLSDDTVINSLNLNKVYILTTESSASASELVINCLRPYIDVVQIGTNTTGKYTASVTLYDSPNFGREEANPDHTYALQPLVLKSANKNGETDYFEGLTPDYTITYDSGSGQTSEGENLVDLGILGDINEPFLAKAISLITGVTSKLNYKKPTMGVEVKALADTKDFTPLGKGMYKNVKLNIKL